ncbi:MAG: hypothetical protein KAV41_01175 [Candidatus Pacebacteria bacterium]|nr:hypothetical protein [Candidatus Paceibacterota bacterium]
MKANINYKFLVVNPENFRFDPVGNQEQAIDLMLEKKGIEIFNLAKHILENGLDKAKDFRVLKKDKRHYLVLDGNRRSTALKCLHDTAIVKDKLLKDKFDSLQIDKTKIPQDIQSFIYKSDKDAAKWIKLDHTGKNQGVGQDPWGSADKERFGYKFEGKISPAMQAVEEVEKEAGIKFDAKKLKISTINRIFSNPKSRSYLGINIEKKKIVFASEKKEVIGRLQKLFDKIIDDKINVAEVYTTEKSINFMKDLFGNKPKLKNERPSLPDISNAENNETQKDETNNSENDDTKVPGTLIKNDWITDKEFRKYKGSDKVKYLLKEMKLIDPKSNSHILMPSLRVLLEISLYHELFEKGYIQKIITKYKNDVKIKNIQRVKKGAAIIEQKRNWSPSFREMLNYISNEDNNVIEDPAARITLDKLVKNGDDFITDLNIFIHNVHSISGKDDPEKTWRKFGRPFLNIIKKIK